MRAHHVIGVDFQLWLSVHLCRWSTTQVAVALVGLNARAVGLYKDFSSKSPHSIVIEHILEHLVAMATWSIVADKRVTVHMLLAASDGHAQQLGLGMFPVDLDMVIVSGKTIDEGDAIDEDIAALVLINIDRRDTMG